MTDIQLPELPLETVLMRVLPDDYYRYGDVRGYTQTQLRKYARAAVLADRKSRWGAEVKAMQKISDVLDAQDKDNDRSFWMGKYVSAIRAVVENYIGDSARAAIPAQPAPGAWQPIETAPKDGTTVVVYFKGHGPMTVAWEDPWGDGPEAATWCVTDHKHGPYPVRGYRTGDDTHWRPLPEPPNGGSHE